jgi:hypothetical protein
VVGCDLTGARAHRSTCSTRSSVRPSSDRMPRPRTRRRGPSPRRGLVRIEAEIMSWLRYGTGRPEVTPASSRLLAGLRGQGRADLAADAEGGPRRRRAWTCANRRTIVIPGWVRPSRGRSAASAPRAWPSP